VCIVGASGKLGRYMVQHSLDRGYEVVGVCREQSVRKLDAFQGRITVVLGATNDPEVVKRAVAGCDEVLVIAGPARGPRVLDGNGSGGAGPRASGDTPRLLLRLPAAWTALPKHARQITALGSRRYFPREVFFFGFGFLVVPVVPGGGSFFGRLRSTTRLCPTLFPPHERLPATVMRRARAPLSWTRRSLLTLMP
jgi:NAD(P)-dependent dehydrogenase (short-subunit alcohol dehydrogenase family)